MLIKIRIKRHMCLHPFSSLLTAEGLYSDITLRSGKATEVIKRAQFCEVLVDSTNSRLLPQKDKSLCDMINTVLPNQWPETGLGIYYVGPVSTVGAVGR